MSLLRNLFKSHKPDADASTRPRLPWPRLHGSKSAAVILEAHLQRTPADGDETSAAAGGRSTPTLIHEDHHPSGHEDPVDAEPARESDESSGPSQYIHGSSRFRDFVKRFRPSKSQERGSLSEAFQPPEQTDIGEVQITDPKKEPRSKIDVGGEFEVQDQHRQVSSQTVQSEESSRTTITVRRHPSQCAGLPMQELGEDWSLGAHLTIDNVAREKAHSPEVSDPFSDGKVAGSYRRAYTSSRYSNEPLQGNSEVSQGSKGRSHIESSSLQTSVKSHSEQSHHGSHYHPHSCSVSERGGISSLSSESSGRSRLNRLDPARAKEAFNAAAAQFNLPLRIAAYEPATAEAIDEKSTLDAGNPPERRYRFLGTLRPVQSIMGLAKISSSAPPPVPKLRRTKTFADLIRRPEPMTSLRGIEVERLARLGGNSFLVLPPNLVPCPVQLPASIVASIVYVRKFGNGTCGGELFVEPGNLKKAIRLYDYFAHHVLSASKDEHEIALNMRVFTMPSWAHVEALSVLSVGWTLKALLAGLPGGILGSADLYNTLKRIYHHQGAVAEAIPRATRTRLITLAIVALTNEMQCALICAIFGLLTGLLEADSLECDEAGYPLREVVSTSRTDGLARAFGPLLTGTETGTGNGMAATGDREDVQIKEAAQVKREIEAERVAGMLLDYWPDISYHLRDWAKVYTTALAEYV